MNAEQHRHAAEKGVKEKLRRRAVAFFAAPDPDQQKSRDQAHLVKQKPEDEILGGERPVECRLHYEHERAKSAATSLREQRERKQDCREQDEEQSSTHQRRAVYSAPMLESSGGCSTNCIPPELGVESSARSAAERRMPALQSMSATAPRIPRAANTDERARRASGMKIRKVIRPAMRKRRRSASAPIATAAEISLDPARNARPPTEPAQLRARRSSLRPTPALMPRSSNRAVVMP